MNMPSLAALALPEILSLPFSSPLSAVPFLLRQSIEGLEMLPSLRVLMLGMNRITRLTNLTSIAQLEVLDLQQNQISTLQNSGIEYLGALRVLNLSANGLEKVGRQWHRHCIMPPVSRFESLLSHITPQCILGDGD
jgi:Leucine-rich repeat (LRR) protein